MAISRNLFQSGHSFHVGPPPSSWMHNRARAHLYNPVLSTRVARGWHFSMKYRRRHRQARPLLLPGTTTSPRHSCSPPPSSLRKSNRDVPTRNRTIFALHRCDLLLVETRFQPADIHCTPFVYSYTYRTIRNVSLSIFRDILRLYPPPPPLAPPLSLSPFCSYRVHSIRLP